MFSTDFPSTVLACNFCAWTFAAAFINALCDSNSKVLSMSFYPNLSQFYPNFIQIIHELKWLAIFVHELSQLPSSMHSVTQSLKCCPCLFIQIYLSFIQISSQFYPYFIQIVHQLKLFAIFFAWTFAAAFINALCETKSKVLSMSFYPNLSQFYPNFISILS